MTRPVIVVLVMATLWQARQAATPPLERFVEASSADERIAKAALAQIAAQWKDSYAAMFVDMARLMRLVVTHVLHEGMEIFPPVRVVDPSAFSIAQRCEAPARPAPACTGNRMNASPPRRLATWLLARVGAGSLDL